jgi:hypothetical protein
MAAPVLLLFPPAPYKPGLIIASLLSPAQMLPEDTPGKAGGPPGNAFELVYESVTDAVRAKMQVADPLLGEWIRWVSILTINYCSYKSSIHHDVILYVHTF